MSAGLVILAIGGSILSWVVVGLSFRPRHRRQFHNDRPHARKVRW